MPPEARILAVCSGFPEIGLTYFVRSGWLYRSTTRRAVAVGAVAAVVRRCGEVPVRTVWSA
jgi:hypothetical protein